MVIGGFTGEKKQLFVGAVLESFYGDLWVEVGDDVEAVAN